MHKSGLGGIIIDCWTDDLDSDAKFWGAALGLEPVPSDPGYIGLATPDGRPDIEVQGDAEFTGRRRVHDDTAMAGDVVGFAYASRYRARYAYRFTLENSVYVAEKAQGQGIGRALLTDLIGLCTALHYRQMIAAVGDGNAASIRLHESVGFRRVGTLQGAGFKLGRWVDVILLQCALGPGDGTEPVA